MKVAAVRNLILKQQADKGIKFKSHRKNCSEASKLNFFSYYFFLKLDLSYYKESIWKLLYKKKKKELD